ncbi:hypothetical protein AB4Y80_00115 [Specibacter sp. RAF43]
MGNYFVLGKRENLNDAASAPQCRDGRVVDANLQQEDRRQANR